MSPTDSGRAKHQQHDHAHAKWPKGLWLWVALGALVGGLLGGPIDNVPTSTPVSSPIAQRNGQSQGLAVTAVRAGGPAEMAGLRVDYIITEINGQPATSSDQLLSLTITKKAGDKVDLTYVRDGQAHATTVTLGSQSY